VNAFFVVRGSDGAFDERKYRKGLDDGAGSFGEIGDFDGADDGKKFVLAVQQAQLGIRRRRRTSQTAILGLRTAAISDLRLAKN